MSTATAPTTNSRTELITNAIDKQTAGALTINRESGGMAFQNMGEVMELAKLMAVSQHAVPPHCRNNPGLCLGLAIQAIEWRMSPYAVASKSYVVNDRISYESQLIHAVIEQRAPITCRLRHSFSGEGDKRRCKVWATAKGETEPLEYVSPEFGKITPKNSPLWKTKPDLQLFYNASRDWARMYFPDVIMGVYAEDELEAMPGSQAVERPRGMEGLKHQLVAGPEDNPADEHEPSQEEYEGMAADQQLTDADQSRDESQDGIDEPAPDETAGDPSQPTAAELEEQASGRTGRGKQRQAFDTHSNVGQ